MQEYLMYKLRLTILLLLALLGAGCAHEPEYAMDQPAPERASTGQPAPEPADSESVAASRDLPKEKPEQDLRYRLPPAQSRSLTIFLGSQTFEYVEDGRVVISGQVSSGNVEHPTPTGDFRVLSKDINKRSGKYTNYYNDNTPMPFSLQFTGPYFVHEGWVPGYADSHGCVRLHYEDAKLLFSRIKVGDRIQVKAQGGARAQNPWPDLFPLF
jgi:lipoprotein-anchoring transpeptidase ErfK/SrfK